MSTVQTQEKRGWFGRLKAGLSRTSNRLSEGIAAIFTKRKLDDETLEELEDLLISADLGPSTAARLTAELAKDRFGREVTGEEVKAALARSMAEILRPVAVPLRPRADGRPFVILMVGVNGTGKTTTIGKLAAQFKAEGRSVMLAAGDTFRAAAIEQLQVWGQRAGCPVVSGRGGGDAAGLAFEAHRQARDSGAEILLVDTAGRLQNKDHLMAELAKIVRVLRKQDPAAPDAVLLVLDATTGQNAHAQARAFGDMVDVTGLIVTKLDGSAKGGVLVSLAESFALPIHAIGVGERLDDLRAFDADDFARGLMGLESEPGGVEA